MLAASRKRRRQTLPAASVLVSNVRDPMQSCSRIGSAPVSIVRCPSNDITVVPKSSSTGTVLNNTLDKEVNITPTLETNKAATVIQARWRGFEIKRHRLNSLSTLIIKDFLFSGCANIKTQNKNKLYFIISVRNKWTSETIFVHCAKGHKQTQYLEGSILLNDSLTIPGIDSDCILYFTVLLSRTFREDQLVSQAKVPFEHIEHALNQNLSEFKIPVTPSSKLTRVKCDRTMENVYSFTVPDNPLIPNMDACNFRFRSIGYAPEDSLCSWLWIGTNNSISSLAEDISTVRELNLKEKENKSSPFSLKKIVSAVMSAISSKSQNKPVKSTVSGFRDSDLKKGIENLNISKLDSNDFGGTTSEMLRIQSINDIKSLSSRKHSNTPESTLKTNALGSIEEKASWKWTRVWCCAFDATLHIFDKFGNMIPLLQIELDKSFKVSIKVPTEIQKELQPPESYMNVDSSTLWDASLYVHKQKLTNDNLSADTVTLTNSPLGNGAPLLFSNVKIRDIWAIGFDQQLQAL